MGRGAAPISVTSLADSLVDCDRAKDPLQTRALPWLGMMTDHWVRMDLWGNAVMVCCGSACVELLIKYTLSGSVDRVHV